MTHWTKHPLRDADAIPRFKRHLTGITAPAVLELGTRRLGDAPSVHRAWAPADAEFIGADFMAGLDVDVVADAETMSEVFGCDRFDGVITVSTFEHIRQPWRAAREIARVLKPGGMVFCHAPFAFPQHGAPDDYWRFTPSGLRVLFEDNGLTTLSAFWEAPARIASEADPATERHETFLHAVILAQRQ